MAKRSRFKDFLWRHSAGIAFLVMVAFVGLIGFVGYTYAVITKKFDSSRRWDVPSRIYSDATPIVPGMTFPRLLLEPKLNHVGYHEARTQIANPGEYRYVNGDLQQRDGGSAAGAAQLGASGSDRRHHRHRGSELLSPRRDLHSRHPARG